MEWQRGKLVRASRGVLMNAAEAMGARDMSNFGTPGGSAADRTPFPGLKG